MAFNEFLADRLHAGLAAMGETPEAKRMFGGLCFMVRGKMALGIAKEDLLMVRMIPTRMEEALSQPHAQPMDFTGKALKGFVFVQPEGYQTDTDLQYWIKMGVEFARKSHVA